MLNVQKRAVKVSENRRFCLIYLIFCIEQVVNMLKDRRFHLPHSIAQQAAKTPEVLEKNILLICAKLANSKTYDLLDVMGLTFLGCDTVIYQIVRQFGLD